MNILEQKIFDSSIIKQSVFKDYYIECNLIQIIISKFQEKIENTFCKLISIFMYFNLFLLGKFLQNCLVEKLLDIGIKIFILIEMILAPVLEYFLKKDIQELK